MHVNDHKNPIYKTTPILLIALLSAATVFAQLPRKVGESDPIPQNGFKTFAELNSWANSSSFGGGRAGELNLSGKKVFFSDRMVTSGVVTAELLFYSLNASGEIHPFIIIPVQRKEFSVKAEDEEIVVRAYDYKTRMWSIALRIIKCMLPN